MSAVKPMSAARQSYATAASNKGKDKHMSFKNKLKIPNPINVLSPDVAFSELKLRQADDYEEQAGVGEGEGEDRTSDYESLSRSVSGSGSELSDEDGYSSAASSVPHARHKADGQKTQLGSSATTRPTRPSVNTTSTHMKTAERSPLSPNSRAWYEFDLAVVVALVSPIGNWLTGTDHVKNLLLVVLLIFYLHQIIEVPWSLYQSTRARRRPPHPSSSTDAQAATALAASELRCLELFFLTLTFLSPLAGAALLRSATSALLGPDAVSWFSTTLFVLATGLRPWAHLVERLAGRVGALQETIHNSPSAEADAEREKDKQRVKALEDRVVELERAVRRARGRADDIERFVGGAMDGFEQALHAQEHRVKRVTAEVRGIEASVEELSNSRAVSPAPLGSARAQREGAGVLSVAWHALTSELSCAVNTLVRRLPFPPSQLQSSEMPSLLELKGSASSSRNPPPSPRGSLPLDTIFEENVLGLGVSPKAGVAVPTHKMFPLGWIWLWLVAAPYALACAIVSRIAYAATLPIRAVERMMVSREY